MDINYDQLISIIQTRITVDNRISRKPNDDGKKQVNNALLLQGFSMALIGTLSFVIPLVNSNLTTALLLFHSMVMIALILSFLSDFSQSLFDTRDTHILLRLPVNIKTISTAKIIIIGWYMLFQTSCIVAIPFIILLFSEGLITAISLLAAVILNTMFSLLLTNIVYLICMRFTTGETFRKILNYIQIIMTILVMSGYLFITQNIESLQFDIVDGIALWNWFTPPAWFAALTNFTLAPTRISGLLALTGIVITVFSFVITLRWLTAYFTLNLNPSENTSTPTKQTYKKEKTIQFLSDLLARNPLQNTAFMLTWRLSSRNMKFNQSVFPMIAYCLVLILIPMYKNFTQNGTTSTLFSQTIPLYITLMGAIMILKNIGYSEAQNLLWIFQTKPLQKPGYLLLGVFKALYIKYIIPLFCLPAIIILLVYGFANLWNVIFIISATTLIITILFSKQPVFPFSRERVTQGSGSLFISFMITSFAGLIMGTIQYFLIHTTFGIIIAIPVIWFGIWGASRKIKSISWTAIEWEYRS